VQPLSTVAAVASIAATTIPEPLAAYLRSPEERQYLQAKLDFMSSVLRKESGAAISVGEFLSENARYFPQVNDDPGTIEQKKLAREQVIKILRTEAGRNFLPPVLVPLELNVPKPVEQPKLMPPVPVIGTNESVQPTVTTPIVPPVKVTETPLTPKARTEILNVIREKTTASEIVKGNSDIDIVLKHLGPLSKREYDTLSPTFRRAIRARSKKLGIAHDVD
jgi:hypothetical protein